MLFGTLAGGLGCFPFVHATYLTWTDSHKAISGRTSYLRVRLEFLRYPHLIPTLFNGCGFGPP